MFTIKSLFFSFNIQITNCNHESMTLPRYNEKGPIIYRNSKIDLRISLVSCINGKNNPSNLLLLSSNLKLMLVLIL